MPSFIHNGSTLVEGIIRIYDGSTWSDEGDNLFGYDGGSWQLIQPYGDEALNAPQNFRVTDLGAETVTLDWDDPAQTITPTHVQLRIIEETSVWTEYDYPFDGGFTWPTLTAETAYQGQVRYIVRVNGIVTLESGTRTVFFTTLPADSPSEPAPNPGGGGPTNSVVKWPPPPGGGVSCDWEYIVQAFAEHGTGGEWGDTTITGTQDGAVEDLVLDFVALGIDCGTVCRFKYREVCSGVPGAWIFDTPFVVACDYTADCGGVPDSTAWSEDVFGDAILAMPQICWDEDERKQVIEDFITKEDYAKGPGFYSPGIVDGVWVLNGAPTNLDYGSNIVAGSNSNLGDLDSTTDFSFSVRFYLFEQPGVGPYASTKLAMFGKRVAFNAAAQGAGVYASVVIPAVSGVPFSLNGTTTLALDRWHTMVVTVDQDGTKTLYVNGNVEDEDTRTVAADLSGMSTDVELYGNASARLGPVGGWARVLDELEVPGLEVEPIFVAGNWLCEAENTLTYEILTNVPIFIPQVSAAAPIAYTLYGQSGRGAGSTITFGLDLPVGTEIRMNRKKGAGTSQTGGNEPAPAGGYTDLRRAPYGQTDHIVIAAGGGGGWHNYVYGVATSSAANHPTGQDGNGHDSAAQGGKGGTQSAGGAAGTGAANDATAGSAYQGGNAGSTYVIGGYGAGGGGGGYFGGGGADKRDGGGGSAYMGGSELVSPVHTVVAGHRNCGVRIQSTAFRQPLAVGAQKAQGAVVALGLSEPLMQHGVGWLDAVTLAHSTTFPFSAGSTSFGGSLYVPALPGARGIAGLLPNERFYHRPNTVGTDGAGEHNGGLVMTTSTAMMRPATAGVGWYAEAFFYFTDMSMNRRIMGHEDSNFSLGNYSHISVNTDGSVQAVSDGSIGTTSSTGVITAGQWYHIGWRLSTANVWTCYVNGTARATVNKGGSTRTAFFFNGQRLGAGTWARSSYRNLGVGCAAIYTRDQIAFDANHIPKVMGVFGL